MSDVYDSKAVEEKLKLFWEREKVYKFDSKKKGKIYSIDTPPPYISGNMHIGHAYSYSQQDFIARFHRMNGNVFYPFGTDDNGLPTERYVEKKNNIKSKSMTRAKFIELCLKTLKEMTPIFVKDWRDLAISCDYDCYYSTIDKKTQKVSQKSFVDLYKQGDIYIKSFPTLWCPDCQTSVAQAELEDRELPSLFSTLKFKVLDNSSNSRELQKYKSQISEVSEDLLIATTRPELLGACVAVFVNPNDSRYKSIIGKKAKVPLFNFEVPIIADESAQLDKGTGVLMICSYGDKYDAEAINRHKLTPKIILNIDGTLNFGDYRGMKIKEARKKILEDLKSANLITEQKNIIHSVNVHDKCGIEIEILPTKQWFIRLLDKKEKLIEQGKKVNWYPEFMFKRYENWVNGLEWDWSISRERHFGIPIPAWQCPKCNEVILPDEKDLPVDPLETHKKCPKCKVEAKGEEKVLDTWATSSLSPQIVSSLVDNKVKIPFSLRPQAHDIIRTWAFYTIAKSYLHEKEIPWKDIVISGYVTMGGEKMSKSKGNVISPQEVMKNYSADALRFAAAGAKLGEDSDYHEKDLIAGKKLETKLWNASKFVFMNLSGYDGKKPKKLERIDELFLDKLNELVKSCTEAFENYEYARAKLETEKFFWQVFCDNYLEIVKKRIYSENQGFSDSPNPKIKEGFRDENKKRKESAQYILNYSLLALLKLFAPIMPFITEEIYQEYYKKTEDEKSIHVSSWPEIAGSLAKSNEKSKNADKSVNDLDVFMSILTKIRYEKSKAQKSMKAEIVLTLSKEEHKGIIDLLDDMKDVSCAKEIKEGKEFGVELV